MKQYSEVKTLKIGVLLLGWAAVCLTPGIADAVFEKPLKNSCITCHRDLGVERLSRPVTLWASSVHAEVGNTCDGCHGGDPADPTLNAMGPGKQFYRGPKDEEVTEFCGKCHKEISVNFKESAHWATGTQNCIQCHGTHTIQRISIEIIDEKKCGTCHDYGLAGKLKAILLNLHERFGKSKEKIKDIRGLPTQPLEKEMAKVWSQLRQVRMISHTFDIDRVRKQAEAVQALMDKTEAEITRLTVIGRERTFLGWGLIALFIALSIATYLYNRTEKKTD